MTFASLVNDLVNFISNSVIPLLFAAAFAFFVFGIFRFFFTGGQENREKGKAFAIWGLVGFVILFSVWGIVRFLLSVGGVTY